MAEIDRNAFRQISYGMYLISSHNNDGKINGQIANVAFLIASKPPIIAISINKENLTHEYISSSKAFTLCILEEETPMTFIGLFGFKSGREIDKFARTKFKIVETGCPVVIEYTLSAIVAKVIKEVDAYTHTMFIGEVISAEVLREGTPLTYANYHFIKGGKSPRQSPTFIGEAKEEKSVTGERKKAMKKYVCNVCGYIYDPEIGDPDGGISPGTSFEDIPDSWVCPICGVGKDQFSPVE